MAINLRCGGLPAGRRGRGVARGGAAPPTHRPKKKQTKRRARRRDDAQHRANCHYAERPRDKGFAAHCMTFPKVRDGGPASLEFVGLPAEEAGCGAAVVATLHVSVTGTVCFDAWHTFMREASPSREHGTPTTNVLRALRRLKFKASRLPTYLSLRNLLPALTEGDLVLTSIRMPRQRPGDTHWVVIAGCSERDGILALNCTGTPLFSKRWISWSEVDERRNSFDIVFRVITCPGKWVEDRRCHSL